MCKMELNYENLPIAHYFFFKTSHNWRDFEICVLHSSRFLCFFVQSSVCLLTLSFSFFLEDTKIGSTSLFHFLSANLHYYVCCWCCNNIPKIMLGIYFHFRIMIYKIYILLTQHARIASSSNEKREKNAAGIGIV